MDNVLILDVSERMKGEALKELLNGALDFIDLVESAGLGDRISIITYGDTVKTIHGLTNNYALLRRGLKGVLATGGVPMHAALATALLELKLAHVASVGKVTILPRVILVTAATPDRADLILEVSLAFAQSLVPVVCLGLPGCDEKTMAALSVRTGGMFVVAKDGEQLNLFLRRQVHLITYVQSMKRNYSNLEDRETIRKFLRDQSKEPVSEEELDGFVPFLTHLVAINVSPPPEPRITRDSTSSARSSVDSRLLSAEKLHTPESFEYSTEDTYPPEGGSWKSGSRCRKVVKMLLTSYIVIFLLIGGGLIGAGAYYMFDHSSFLFRIVASSISIGTGSFLIIQALLAAIGGHRGSKCLFYSSSSMGILVLACTCGSLAMLLLYYTHDNIPLMVTEIWDQDFNNDSVVAWQEYFGCCGIQIGDTRYCNSSLPVQLPTCANQTITFVREQVLFAELLLGVLTGFVCFASLFSILFTCYYGKHAGSKDAVSSLRLLSE